MRKRVKELALVLVCLVAMGALKPILKEELTDFDPSKISFNKEIFQEGLQSTKEFLGNLGNMKLETGVNYDVEDAMTFVDTHEIWEDDLSKTYLTQGELPESMKVMVGGGNLIIEETSEEEIYIEAEGGFRLQGYVEAGQLTVSMVSKSVLTTDYESPEVRLYIPEDLNLFDVYIDAGAGDVYLNGVSAATMKAKVGAGTVVMEDMVISDADLSVAAGNMNLTGEVKGSVKAVLTAGKMHLQIDGKESDFDYRVSETAGSVLLDGEGVFTEDDKAAKIENGATKSMELYCTMGEIKVDFTPSI